MQFAEPALQLSSFEKKDDRNNYRYHVPKNLDAKTKKAYIVGLNSVFRLYSEILDSLIDFLKQNPLTSKEQRGPDWEESVRVTAIEAATGVLPLAAKRTLVAYGSGRAIDELITNLSASTLSEAELDAKLLLDSINRVDPVFAGLDNPVARNSAVAYRQESVNKVAELTKKYLNDNYAGETDPIDLINFTPKNELDMVANMLFESSGQPFNLIKLETGSWSINKKIDVFVAYVAKRSHASNLPGPALKNVSYNLELITDSQMFRVFQNLGIGSQISWQLPSPRYGYDLPLIVDEALLGDKYEQCFKTSIELYSLLQQAGFETEAQYATLLGHKIRWQISLNAIDVIQLFDLLDNPKLDPKARVLIAGIREKLSEVHPMFLSSISVINGSKNLKPSQK